MKEPFLKYHQEPTLFIRDVAKVDCAIFDPALGVVGQSWHVDLTLAGDLDANGFVYDFSPLKKLIKQVLHSSFDHALIIPLGSQTVQYREAGSHEEWILKAKSRNGKETCWSYQCPKGAVLPIRSVNLTKNILEQECTRLLKHRLPVSFSSLGVKLRDETINLTEASYRYTHGISGHEGLCQRLFHGHRSRIEIYVNEERRADLEHFIARDIFGSNIHIATYEQAVEKGLVKIGVKNVDDTPVTLRYQGTLGEYQATLPLNRVFFVESSTSIESISQEIARLLKKEEQITERIRTVCFEGIDKGAMAEL